MEEKFIELVKLLDSFELKSSKNKENCILAFENLVLSAKLNATKNVMSDNLAIVLTDNRLPEEETERMILTETHSHLLTLLPKFVDEYFEIDENDAVIAAARRTLNR